MDLKEKVKVDENVYEIDNIRFLGNLLEITFDENVDVSALDASTFSYLTLLTRGDDVCGEYEGYETCYKVDGQTMTLSNDGSTEETPAPAPEPEPDVEPEVIDIAALRDRKIAELKAVCNDTITMGVDVEIDGIFQHFSYTLEDQTNIKDAFDLALQTGLAVPYHSDGAPCRLYPPEDIIRIFVAEKSNLTYHTTYFNQARAYIMTLEDANQIQLIQYGMRLPEPYASNLAAMMDQARLVIETLLAPLNNTTATEDEQTSAEVETPVEETTTTEEVTGEETSTTETQTEETAAATEEVTEDTTATDEPIADETQAEETVADETPTDEAPTDETQTEEVATIEEVVSEEIPQTEEPGESEATAEVIEEAGTEEQSGEVINEETETEEPEGTDEEVNADDN